MNDKCILFILFIPYLTSIGQTKIFGVVKGEKPLAKVNITIAQLELYTVSSKNGSFEFNDIPKGNFSVQFSYVGYKTHLVDINVEKNSNYELNINLEEKLIKLGEAVVISSKSDILLKDLPVPLELVDSDKLNSSSEISISDLMKRESGISVIRDGPWATAINVWGLSKQNLVYLIDGNRIETSTNIAAGLSLMDLNDFESVEIVKGGFSSLYGTGATGGVINIRSKTADFQNMSYLSSQVISSYNSVNNGYSYYLNLKSGGENWSLKLNGSIREGEDIKIPGGTLDNSSFKDESISASLKYSPLEDLTFNIDIQKFSAYDVGIPGGAPFPQTATATYKYAIRELLSPSIEFQNISDYLLNIKLNYYHQVISRSVELKPNPMVTANPKADHTTSGLSFQSDWYLSNSNLLTVGVDYWHREYFGERKVINNARNVETLDKPIPNSKFASLGFYAQDKVDFSSDLNMTISGRYDIINIENQETKNPQYTIINGVKNENVRNDLTSFDSYSETNKSFSGGFGVIYNLMKDLDLVLNLGYNFRSPSLEERYQYIDLGEIVYLGNPELKPEEGIFLDGGFRIWNDYISVRLNGFLNSFSNLVLDDMLYTDSIYIKKNIGKARLLGFDTRVDYNFYRHYMFYAKAALVRGEDLSQGTNLPQIPPFNGLIGLIIPVTDIFNADLSLAFASDQNKTDSDELRTGGFTYFDLSLTSRRFNFGFFNFKFITGVHNISNKKYREHLSTYRGVNRLEPGRNIFAKLIIDLE